MKDQFLKTLITPGPSDPLILQGEQLVYYSASYELAFSLSFLLSEPNSLITVKIHFEVANYVAKLQKKSFYIA